MKNNERQEIINKMIEALKTPNTPALLISTGKDGRIDVNVLSNNASDTPILEYATIKWLKRLEKIRRITEQEMIKVFSEVITGK